MRFDLAEPSGALGDLGSFVPIAVCSQYSSATTVELIGDEKPGDQAASLQRYRW